MKALKKIGRIVLWIFAILLLIIITMPMWISPVACTVANLIVPGMTKTAFRVERIYLNPLTGYARIGNLKLENPSSFSERVAVDLRNLEVDFAMTSLLGRKFRVEDIELDGLKVYTPYDFSNFKEIGDNVSDGKKSAKDERQADAKSRDAAKTGASASRSASAEAEEERPKKGVEIDHLLIRDVSIKYGVIVFPFAFEKSDIGKDSAIGASLQEIWNELLAAILQSLNAVGGSIVDLGKNAYGVGKDGIKNIHDAVRKLDTNRAVDAVIDVGKAVQGLFK